MLFQPSFFGQSRASTKSASVEKHRTVLSGCRNNDHAPTERKERPGPPTSAGCEYELLRDNNTQKNHSVHNQKHLSLERGKSHERHIRGPSGRIGTRRRANRKHIGMPSITPDSDAGQVHERWVVHPFDLRNRELNSASRLQLTRDLPRQQRWTLSQDFPDVIQQILRVDRLREHVESMTLRLNFATEILQSSLSGYQQHFAIWQLLAYLDCSVDAGQSRHEHITQK